VKTIVPDKALIAFCGLYCGACRQYLAEKCPGCRKNEKASWCKIRQCGLQRGYASCADCTQFAEATACKTFDNLVGRIFGFLFRSNRPACIAMIKKHGYAAYALFMAQNKLQSIKR